MVESHFYADFPAGNITERIVDAVTKLPIWEFVALSERGLVRIPARAKSFSFPNLTHRNLFWDKIDDYAKASGTTLSYLIYGDETPKETRYSFFDEEVLEILNIMPPFLVQAASKVVEATFSNPRFFIPLSSTPSAKLLEIAFAEGRRTWEISEEEAANYATDIRIPLEMLRTCRKKERIVFHIDYILDLCEFFKVSPHFVFSLQGPLLCEHKEGDAFFDQFCLLSRRTQALALKLLMDLYPVGAQQLPAGKWQSVLNKIEAERSVVSWN